MSRIPADVISQVMSQFGKLGGSKGGKRCLETMTAEQRTKRARDAVNARWKKAREKKGTTK